MKQKLLSVLLVLAMALTLLPTAAFAVEGPEPELEPEMQLYQEGTTETPGTNETPGTTGITTETETLSPGSYTVSTEIALTKGLKISGEVTLNLEAGGKLTSSAADTITVESTGALTITGTGTITNSKNEYGALVNKGGTVYIQGGTISKTQTNNDTGNGGRAWYVIKNMGTMTISGGTVKYDGSFTSWSSMIANGWANAANPGGNDRNVTHSANATLTITKGEFSGGMNTVKNDDYGVLTVGTANGQDSEITFTNTAGPVILNWGTATINSGTFTRTANNTAGIAKNGDDVISSGGSKSSLDADPGTLIIKGGKFTGASDNVLFSYPVGADTLDFDISGGTFEGPSKLFVTQADTLIGQNTVPTGGTKRPVSISGGTFPVNVDTKYLATGKVCTANSGNTAWTVGDAPAATAPTLTVEKATLTEAEVTQLGASSADLGSYTVTTGENGAVTISGTVKHAGMSNWNVPAEVTGHYVALKVTSSVSKIKTFNHSAGAAAGKEITLPAASDSSGTYSDTVVFWLDGTHGTDCTLPEKTFKITAAASEAEGAPSTTLTVSYSGATLESAPAEGALGFAKMPTEITNIYGRNPADMGTFEVTTEGNTITVTGTANYITGYTGFNGDVTDEQKGHYLPIKITGKNGQQIVVKNVSAGSGTDGKSHTFGSDASLEMVLWLDGDRTNREDLSPAKIIVTTGEGESLLTYTIDFSDLVLLPNSTVNNGKIDVTVDPNEAESLGNLIKDNNVDIPDTEKNDAPIKVEGTGGDKTLTFTGKDGTTGAQVQNTTAVTLPKKLVDVVVDTGNTGTKADVKVDSKNGSVTIPSENLSVVTGNDATVEITVAKAVENDVKDATVEGVEDASAIQNALKTDAEKGVTVTATSGGNNLITNAEGDKAVTVVIKVDNSKTYVLLCVSGEASAKKVTSFGKYTGVSEIKVKTKHLTTFVPVEEKTENAAALAAVPADPGKVQDPAPTDNLTCEYWASMNYTDKTENGKTLRYYNDCVFGAKLKLGNLSSSTKYVIQFAKKSAYNASNCTILVFETGAAETTKVIDVLPSANTYTVSVFKCGSYTKTEDLTATNLKAVDATIVTTPFN